MNIRLILDFLHELQKNNSKSWMDENRERYLVAKGEFHKLTAHLLDDLRLIDPQLNKVTPGECIFRINKNDFSKKGEPPYKDHFGAGISPGGRHSPFANYVLVLSPGGKSRAGGGIRQPKPKQLELIRQEIDYSPGELESILAETKFKEAFVGLRGEQRKTAPKGYNKDAPNIELIKYNGYQVLHYFTDEEVCAPDFPDSLPELYRTVKPLHDFLNRPLAS
ncbi:uncharacterized protein (TIGR02453 family) [Pontibacter aydingkolensis]|uniref:DUF2461 domain-containing protein n=1 Tax=Pontibacter aydingkolensis TaxID=1911536 RepID=A0ABS7CYJ9_9BACT|nr:DUF2461 domain-containing protein [Pontibacter aydingkolensis]MBW7468890.1 DUF2461 domain-containing protein [Pontibacter aydingkolensis]